jgi:hypothetical protein
MGAPNMASGKTSAELAGSERDEERSMCSSHDAPLSEVWILRVLCNASDTFRQVALGKSPQRSMSGIACFRQLVLNRAPTFKWHIVILGDADGGAVTGRRNVCPHPNDKCA